MHLIERLLQRAATGYAGLPDKGLSDTEFALLEQVLCNDLHAIHASNPRLIFALARVRTPAAVPCLEWPCQSRAA